MQRDSLDFKTLAVGKLFTKQFFPALLGMISAALFTVVDGIFVGRGIGSDALAAVNIAAPIAMISAGIGLMFGMGGGILSSINLSRGKPKVANINVTQATSVLLIFVLIMTLLLTLFPHKAATLCGSDDYLLPMAVEYLFWFALSIPFLVLTVSLPFFVRQTNPNYAMWAMLIATVINIVLDYIFIFIFEWGLFGAAVATGIGEAVGAIMLFVYLLYPSVMVRFAKLKMSSKSILLTMRNTWYILKLGISSCLSEITLAIMAITGNYVFMHHLGADGVAAYSIICYLFPIIFMVFNAMVQSAQPIISYNYGCGQMERSNQATRLSLTYAIVFGLFITALFSFYANGIVSLFLPEKTGNAWEYAAFGLPLFAIDYVFFGINIITIGYYTSIERVKRAIGLTILRGILPVLFFFCLPLWFGVTGIWLSVATGDFATTVIIVILLLKDKAYTYGRADKQNQEILQAE
ncbi:putative MATE family efflux protein [Parabacteroides sp. PF5-5]|uniref:MATE family efflux transporter n=1 Tax=unclassified Parabacteroides TaxID=2649774 RepID=UPI0024761264|nr:MULTISPECIES: MATE family efflux transporter [unclassified Parabacteroides]MDH6303722.1 putative MATE family efflux protein [Parabacteroides sp. PH5-39]MDH6314339.1 putative MATE family efflux protein [Parabacteroides sp. PF5-13]MDH6318597.1 putative MATE family efflux protein [Parabacteroides sp. PH5-13]MDH6322111.1 putative MATE family efflux protein [Parabacteroides sp. PH5-8]MDH6325810.1 putative MATE family efflux protein [Parabacteroides sp. PH5-41]